MDIFYSGRIYKNVVKYKGVLLISDEDYLQKFSSVLWQGKEDAFKDFEDVTGKWIEQKQMTLDATGWHNVSDFNYNSIIVHESCKRIIALPVEDNKQGTEEGLTFHKNRADALDWYRTMHLDTADALLTKYYPGRYGDTLTGREIQQMWELENPERGITIVSTPLADTGVQEKAIYFTIQESFRLLELEDDWDGYNGAAVNKQAFNKAIIFLMLIINDVPDIFIPEINPCPNATVDICFRKDNGYRLLINVGFNKASCYGDNGNTEDVLKSDDLTTKDVIEWCKKFMTKQSITTS